MNNHTLANTYNNKLIEFEEKDINFMKKIYLFDMNYKIMAKSEDYKYIVINGAQNNFNITYLQYFLILYVLCLDFLRKN